MSDEFHRFEKNKAISMAHALKASEARKKVLFTWPWPHFLEVSLSSGRGPYAGFRRGAWLLLRVPSCGPQL